MMKTTSQRQRGLTLVELMVGLVIGLVLSLAAASLYLATRETSRGSQSISDVNETGKIALEMIGREIQKAGFYPAEAGNDVINSNAAGEYVNVKQAGNPTFDTGLFGCSGAQFNPVNDRCGATVAGAPDTIIVNYFSSREFGNDSLLGNSHDCNRVPVADDAVNTARAASNLPLFVSNRFSIVGTATDSYTDTDGNLVTARSLGCHGNGDEAQTEAQRALDGVEDMVVRYGIYGAGMEQSPTQFLTATQVNAAGTIDGRTPWQRVTAVNVCIVVRSLANTRQEDEAGNVRQYRNCRSAVPVDLPAGARFVYKSFERVYAVRNNLTGSL